MSFAVKPKLDLQSKNASSTASMETLSRLNLGLSSDANSGYVSISELITAVVDWPKYAVVDLKSSNPNASVMEIINTIIELPALKFGSDTLSNDMIFESACNLMSDIAEFLYPKYNPDGDQLVGIAPLISSFVSHVIPLKHDNKELVCNLVPECDPSADWFRQMMAALVTLIGSCIIQMVSETNSVFYRHAYIAG